MATEWQRRNLERILGELRAFERSLPPNMISLPARYADDYKSIIADLQDQGIDTKGLALPPDAVAARLLNKNVITGKRDWTPPMIDRTVLVRKVSGAIAYIESILNQGSEKKQSGPSSGALGPITISGSNVNLGTMHGDMRTSIQVIQGRGQEQLARLLADLVARIPASRLSALEKDDAEQLVEALAREVATRPAGKLSAAVRPVASALGSILTRSAELAQIWQAIEPLLK